MTLDLYGEKQIARPSDDAIGSGIVELDSTNNAAFAVLSQSDLTYIQISGDKNNGFVLEYQAGSVDAHFKVKNANITFDQAVKAFISYRDGSREWQSSFTFARISW